MYVYKNSEPGLWTVGFYAPDGKWDAQSDHKSEQDAIERVAMLNGGSLAKQTDERADNMTLRDYFAGQAIAWCQTVTDPCDVALEAYAIADALLAERAKTGGGK